MSITNEFQSQPCVTIHYTYDKTLEGSSCCQFFESVHTHLILVRKVGEDLATFVPTRLKNSFYGDHCRHQIPISTLYDHSSYL